MDFKVTRHTQGEPHPPSSDQIEIGALGVHLSIADAAVLARELANAVTGA